jgi:tetratricopeptide (TPR) repeat protein
MRFAMTDAIDHTCSLDGRRVALVGGLAAMSKREAAGHIRQRGAALVERPDEADLIVVGLSDLPLRYETGEGALGELVDPEVREAAEAGRVEVIGESQLWQRLGVLDESQHVRRLYTPGMLAGLLGVSVAVIRRWRRRGLIRPAREVRRLEYYDFQEVTTARRLAELLASGVSPQRIEKQLAALRRVLPEVERPLAQLSVIVEGRDILLRQGDGLVDAAGQRRFNFEAGERAEEMDAAVVPFARRAETPVPGAPDAADATPEEMIDLAEHLEDLGRLEAAETAYRVALASGGPRPAVCFQLAELLYRRGDLPAARERYYMAIELDEDFVEARANLGCVLAELGQRELAVAAFEGALQYHGEYPDAHYHLARTLCDLGREADAATHWRSFLELSPESPWAEEARRELVGFDTCRQTPTQ